MLPILPERQGRSFEEEREFVELPERLEALEAELESVGEALADPALYRDSADEVRRLSDRSTVLSKEIEALYERWEILEAQGAR
jgi:ATP-binding cassette subfamily F protein uup